MCGLTGFWNFYSQDKETTITRVSQMAQAIFHRGPDGQDVWAQGDIAFAHRRLAILDLSEAGKQPMTSPCGRYTLVYNGEIYNHLDLRTVLAGENAAPDWRGHSDTETLLAGIAHWGLAATLRKCTGMFALALWDHADKTLRLARDRFGEKPLYYGWTKEVFLFGSELKALRAHPSFTAEVCPDALAEYLRFTYVPAPLSIYQGVFKLEAGCVLTLESDPVKTAPTIALRPGEVYQSLSIQRYWSLKETIETAQDTPLPDTSASLDNLEAVLEQSVQGQMLSDVPLGAFLSGGIDSSLIVALMQAHSTQPVKTFTIGFEDPRYDESAHASAVARHLGTEHTEIMITDADAQEVIPNLPHFYDEPFADSSQIPTHLVCKATQQNVTVALSGDAGDELFGGYNRYFWNSDIWQKVAWMPFFLRKTLGHLIFMTPGFAWAILQKMRPSARHYKDKALKMAARLTTVRTPDDLYLSLVREWDHPNDILQQTPRPPYSGLLQDPLPEKGVDTPQEQMMFRDTMTYLPDDILCKVDRAAMATSLETRVPFLDHHVAQIAWRLPLSMKMRGRSSKWALRQILYKHVPKELIERPKAGFGIPLDTWLRGPLKPWAEALLDPDRLTREGYFQAQPIQKIWNEHLSGERNWTPRLWTILMFQSWLEKQ